MLKVGELKTLKDIIIKKCDEFASNVAFLEKDKKTKKFEEITYDKLKEDTVALATALVSKYKLKDKKVAVIGENSYKWYVSYLAVTTGVGTIVPLDKELPANEIENLLNRSKAGCIIYSSKKEDVIFEIKKKVSKDIIFINMDKEKSDDESLAFIKVIEEGKKCIADGDTSYIDYEYSDKDFRILLFTSGTTAQSKGVMLCHRNVIANLEGAPNLLKVYPKDRFFSVLPMHHIYESIVGTMYPLVNGASVAICTGLKYVSQELQETKPSIIVGVPLLLEHMCSKIAKTIKAQGKEALVQKMTKLTNSLGAVGYKLKKVIFKQVHQGLGGNLRTVLVSAAPVPKELIDNFEGFGINVLQGYGLSETAPVVAGTPEKNRVAGTVGKASNCEIKLDNIDEKGIGEIIVKGPNVMLGYYDDEESTHEVIVDGWFHTGDLGRLDDKGNLIITGRCKSVIVTPNGKNIFPEEIEDEINKFPEIKECLVYGEEKDDDTVISAVVTLDDEYLKEKYGKDVPEMSKIKEIIWEKIKELNKKMVSYKAVKNVKIRTTDFVKTTTMKIKRFLDSNKKGE
ncbi:MAG: AMP-binding protein [Clostridia bacterium]|nr:AMP-binding protein [Clostridia bacterium]